MELSNFQQNIPLSSYTTFKIGGKADYFYIAKTEKSLIEALNLAWQKNLPVFILGGGSNILISDKGFRGLVMGIRGSKFEVRGSRIFAEAGVSLAQLVKVSIKASLTGLEWAAGIPGATLGGAIRGNAGAFGLDIGSLVDKVRVLSGRQVKEYSKKDCQFSYRDSIFKHSKDVILSAVLELKKINTQKIQRLTKEYLKQRQTKQPTEPSAGSVFKNILLHSPTTKSRDAVYSRLYKIIPKDKINNGKIPAGYLIEGCGLKGKQIGQAQISKKHANFIVNLGGAKAADVVALIKLAKQKARQKFGIELQEEIEYLGF